MMRGTIRYQVAVEGGGIYSCDVFQREARVGLVAFGRLGSLAGCFLGFARLGHGSRGGVHEREGSSEQHQRGELHHGDR